MRDILNEAAGLGKDPVMASRTGMKPVLPRRFYERAEAGAEAEGHGVLLDGKPVRTPARRKLLLPCREAAELVAAEFAAQAEHIDPARMPVTRLVNSILDGVADDPQPVAEDLVRFAGSDLLCYRAGSPRELVARQSRLWDPVLAWMRDSHGAHFVMAQGVMHVEQPATAIAAFASSLRHYRSPLAMGAIHSAATLTGSAILALALAHGFLDTASVWEAANVDENWNEEHWGEDMEASQRRAARALELRAAADLIAALPMRGRE